MAKISKKTKAEIIQAQLIDRDTGEVFMACTLQILIGDDAERMLEKYNISARETAVNAIQEAIHIAAITSEPWWRTPNETERRYDGGRD